MKKAVAVIGSGYGDEGKGLMTDHFARSGASMVVRSNGGAQAGHTVVTPEGAMHVFHHVPSGAMAGVPGHLSHFFVSHPMMLGGELAALRDKGFGVQLSADPNGLVTTPYDVMINQIVEEARGSGRHGSCGMGFGETIERSLVDELSVTVGLLKGNPRSLKDRLKRIRTDWMPKRLSVLGIYDLSDEWKAVINQDGILDRFIEDCGAFDEAVSLMQDTDLPDGAVFEGAQGLLLDQDYGSFPHVTRSNTGLRNISVLASMAGMARVDATYVSRIYATRHGAGPLAGEGEPLGEVSPIDPTNVVNEWQGAQRVAPLDVDILSHAVRHDLESVVGCGVKIEANLAVTCLDQVGRELRLMSDGRLVSMTPGDAVDLITDKTGLSVERMSFGPSHSDIAYRGSARSLSIWERPHERVSGLVH